MSNPFDGPNPFGMDPTSLIKNTEAGIKCPVCEKRNFTANASQYGITRTCLECKNVWSGGSAVSVEHGEMIRKLSSNPEGQKILNEITPPKGVPAPDDYPNDTQYMGSSFRDDFKTYDGDE